MNMFGEIALCQFPFSSGVGGKIRPALVLFDLQRDAIICRVTSVPHFTQLDVKLNDWQAAGLLKPSVARVGRLVTAEKTIFLRRLGSLTAADANAVRQCWNLYMRL